MIGSEVIIGQMHLGATSADQTQKVSRRQTVRLSLPVSAHTRAPHGGHCPASLAVCESCASWPPVNEILSLSSVRLASRTQPDTVETLLCLWAFLPVATEPHPRCERVRNHQPFTCWGHARCFQSCPVLGTGLPAHLCPAVHLHFCW